MGIIEDYYHRSQNDEGDIIPEDVDFYELRKKHKVIFDVSEMHLDSLARTGEVCDYYGADTGEREFRLGDAYFKVLEDPEDGYRSNLGGAIWLRPEDSKGLMFQQPIARVVVTKGKWEGINTYDEGPFVGYRLVDHDTGHIWLEFGTANTEDYYPYFVFTHHPAPGPLTEII